MPDELAPTLKFKEEAPIELAYAHGVTNPIGAGMRGGDKWSGACVCYVIFFEGETVGGWGFLP